MAANPQPSWEGSEPEDFVICRICGRRFSFLNILHLRVHGTTLAEYKKKFPGAPTASLASRNRKRDGQNERWTSKARKKKSRDMTASFEQKLAECAAQAAKLASESPLAPLARVTVEEAAARVGVPVHLLRSWISRKYIPPPTGPDGLYTAAEVEALIKWKAERPDRLAEYNRNWLRGKYHTDLPWKGRKLAQGAASRARVMANPKRAAKHRRRQRKKQRIYRAKHPEKGKQYRDKQKKENDRIREELKLATAEVKRLQAAQEGQEAQIANAVNHVIPRFTRLFRLPDINRNPRTLLDGWSHPDFEWEAVRAAREAVISRRPPREWPTIAARWFVALTMKYDITTVKRYHNRTNGGR
jgi:hypothetical protein